ncbi:MAG: 30S ribosomal protein S5 [Candidatus Woesearchaeota archaeon]|jgi:small subunit ribosomal protein S5|nr:30S ribosomal protein S5 [Candidatus Woesearchaeota archaeon]MDP7181777.1 30S ribosomal protein S5 [Candidatus Woesearchaeota archaeon]MDP7198866.1 30S ribosomal protein S5 [Candidatus Woesearchaeota archaeon]MDP7467134.1 30S ribosomal protein S5 [Candidatus Woesearchaeota archaeon]MDP7647531.1 30S ribosomal protein S5 [Candidatus Woesearchaeota archaeon]
MEEVKPAEAPRRQSFSKGQRRERRPDPGPDLENWKPQTSLGLKVKDKKITDLTEILSSGTKILETEIVDTLLPNIESELLMIGQSKGKFGGGARRIFRQTQKKTPEGNKPSFGCYAVVGNQNGFVGAGTGKSKDTVPSREKAVRKAKLNIFKIKRGCGSWQCGCKEPHSIPFAIEGKSGSVEIRLIPAPKGTGLVVERECQKVLKLAGIKDVWSKTSGQTKIKQNLITALTKALKTLRRTKMRQKELEILGAEE